jgi:hypothetical protein
MAYPNLLYKGQYTLKRVLTMPLDTSGTELTKADIAKTVSLNSGGDVVIGAADAPFWGVLRTVNNNDHIATVDFSGVHSFEANGAIQVGDPVAPDGAGSVKKAADSSAATTAVALTAAANGEDVSIFFLN